MGAILEATVRVLVREGYEGATTSRIAEVSGYGVGSLYDYFPNKEALVAALIEHHAQRMVAVVESTFHGHADSPLPVAVRAWVEAGVEAHLANPELHKVLVEQVPRVGDLERIGAFGADSCATSRSGSGWPATARPERSRGPTWWTCCVPTVAGCP